MCRVLDDYRQSGWQADFVAVTGDLIQDDSAEAYVHFREVFGALGLPVLCVPGNHDVRALMKEALSAEPFHYCGAVEANNWLVVGIDSCVSEQAGGHVGAAELDRLAAIIDSSAMQHVLILLHHPPVPMGSRWLDSVGMDNGAEFLDKARASGRVRLALFGHVHQAYDADHDGIRVVGTPSTCRQFAKGSAEFALDDNPPAYRRLSLHADGRFEHELVWVNS